MEVVKLNVATAERSKRECMVAQGNVAVLESHLIKKIETKQSLAFLASMVSSSNKAATSYQRKHPARPPVATSTGPPHNRESFRPQSSMRR